MTVITKIKFCIYVTLHWKVCHQPSDSVKRKLCESLLLLKESELAAEMRKVPYGRNLSKQTDQSQIPSLHIVRANVSGTF